MHEDLEAYLQEAYHTTIDLMGSKHGVLWADFVRSLEIDGLIEDLDRDSLSELSDRVDRFIVSKDEYTTRRKKFLKLGI
jgi:hypothetical protein